MGLAVFILIIFGTTVIGGFIAAIIGLVMMICKKKYGLIIMLVGLTLSVGQLGLYLFLYILDHLGRAS